MFLENKLDAWVESIRTELALPLRLELWNGKKLNFSQDIPKVVVKIPNASALTYFFTPSLFNLGTAYVEGKIDVQGKAKEIISIGNALAAHTLKLEGKFSRIFRPLLRNKKIDTDAVRFHYDISNDFFKCWLDENMVYSCAYFENGDETLSTAQIKKIDHILTKLQVRPGDQLLDIGCGWGALVIRAAKKFGAKCVGVTLSENQAKLAKENVLRIAPKEKIEILLQDYRDISGTFNRITSVGMFEHVGISNLPKYFEKINSLLANDGLAMNHGITSTDPDSGETPYGGGEFIEKYVFPYGQLPHIGLALRAMQQGGLEVLDVENLRHHYVRTCNIWLDNFESKEEKIKSMIGDKRFRIWQVYLAGCSHAFLNDWISIYQVMCAKAGNQNPKLPWSRRYMYGL